MRARGDIKEDPFSGKKNATVTCRTAFFYIKRHTTQLLRCVTQVENHDTCFFSCNF